LAKTARAGHPEAPADGSRFPPTALLHGAVSAITVQMVEGSEPVAAAHGQSRRHLPALDGLRALAIAAVVWHHSLPRAFPGWLGRGHAGVPLFFALSGFLITRLLCAERRTTGDIALGSFWMRRSLRIFPLYYAVLAGFALYLSWLEPTDATRHFFDNLPFYASYTSNWFVEFGVPHPIWFGFAWSLATEEQFYLWWPPLLWLGVRLGQPVAALGLAFVLLVDQLAEHGALVDWLAPGSLGARVSQSASAAMALGALLALALAQPSWWRSIASVLGARHALWVTLVLVAAWLYEPVGPPIVLDAAFAALVGAAALWRGHGWLGRVLASRVSVRVGQVSYGIYLLHIPAIGLLERALPWLRERPLALFPLAFGLGFATAATSYRYVEAPLLALRDRCWPRSAPRARPAGVQAARRAPEPG
jgi:peptidoglycan/LPS O-acetylase OafA/YrhL